MGSEMCIRDRDLLADDGIIILEDSVDAEVEPKGFEILADKNWGAARVLFMKPNT